MVLFWILASTFLVSLISLVGIFTLALKDNLLHKLLFCLIGFSAGALIGSAFLHILPECLENNKSTTVFSYLILGIIIFFLMERYLHWRHCHEEGGACQTHSFTYLNLIGDGFHNFIDGLVIAASFIVSLKLGLVTTLAIILHEIPQEIGDFGVLIYGGFKKTKALFLNFLSGITAIFGGIVGFLLSEKIGDSIVYLLPFAAGTFIYIACSDLIPEIKEKGSKESMINFLVFLLGIGLMILMKSFI